MLSSAIASRGKVGWCDSRSSNFWKNFSNVVKWPISHSGLKLSKIIWSMSSTTFSYSVGLPNTKVIVRQLASCLMSCASKKKTYLKNTKTTSKIWLNKTRSDSLPRYCLLTLTISLEITRLTLGSRVSMCVTSCMSTTSTKWMKSRRIRKGKPWKKFAILFWTTSAWKWIKTVRKVSSFYNCSRLYWSSSLSLPLSSEPKPLKRLWSKRLRSLRVTTLVEGIIDAPPKANASHLAIDTIETVATAVTAPDSVSITTIGPGQEVVD